MLKAAIEKIEEMARGNHVIAVDGKTFARDADGNYKELIPEPVHPNNQRLTSLDAVVKMVRTEAIKYKKPIYIEAVHHQRVNVFVQPDSAQRCSRPTLYEANATDVPGWDAEVTMPFDRAAVALQTRFQPNKDQVYALQLLSQITTGAKVTYNDTGIATTVVTQKGVALQQNATIRPIIELKPYRTFQELEQPEGTFLIRINERGITFTEADGGMWKLEARKRIVAYFEDKLKEEIERGDVVVML